MFFKKKKKEEKEICFHEWRVIDFVSEIDSSLAYEEHYELGCVKCCRTKIVDKYGFKELVKVGLIQVNKNEN